MASTSTFTGLSMPVFTAFGWAGEEAALNFALEQLELFAKTLQASLPRSLQNMFPYAGLSAENQTVYLAAAEDPEEDIHIVFLARPLSLEMQLSITDQKVLAKGLKAAMDNLILAHRLVTELGAEWTLRVQQMEVDDESGEVSHYADLFKDELVHFDQEKAAEVFSKAAYLNGEDHWLTPIYLSRRFSAEQASAMGPAIIQVMVEHVTALEPLLQFLTGDKGKRKSSKARTKAKKKTAVSSESLAEVAPQIQIDPEDGFVHVAEIKPLHLRRGFINLTPKHWPFFAINSRTETRPVTVYYEGVYDKASSVWRLKPNDLARIVLSPPVHQWLEDNFDVGDRVQVIVTRLDNEEIQVSLKAVE